MSCCNCCCLALEGECCGPPGEKICCKAPQECCNTGEEQLCCAEGEYCCKEQICCTEGRECCGTEEEPSCCLEEEECCFEVLCCFDGRCCGTEEDPYCCEEGECCYDGVCEPCECEEDADCEFYYCTDAGSVADCSDCPEGYECFGDPGSLGCQKNYDVLDPDGDCESQLGSPPYAGWAGPFTASGYCCDGECSPLPCPDDPP